MADPVREQLAALVRAIEWDRSDGNYDHGPCADSYRMGKLAAAEAMLKAYDEAIKSKRRGRK